MAGMTIQILETDEPTSTAKKYQVGELIGLRILLGFALFFITAFAAIALAVTLIASILFRKRVAQKAWKAACTSSALATGCFIAIFSPRFGIATICTYFVLRESESTFVQSLRSQFDSAFHRF